jgi:vacuolar-type H+-ATPase subunit F/Vma7
MKGKAAVFGGTDFVKPFSALGLDTFTVGRSKKEIIENAKKIIGGEYKLIIVAEDIAAEAEEVFSERQNTPDVCILVVPFTAGSKGFATKALAEILKLATGVNLEQKGQKGFDDE